MWPLLVLCAVLSLAAGDAGAGDSALRAGQGDFDETGTIPCAQNPGEAMGTCSFGVARADGREATVIVTFHNGFRRTLFFEKGEFIRGDTTMSGTGRDTDWQVEAGTHFIRIDDQRYELQGADLFGE